MALRTGTVWGGALGLLEFHSRLLDQTQSKNGSALSQSVQMGPPNYCGQMNLEYDGLHKKAELVQIGGRPVRQALQHQGRDPI